jgi:hypothetical protein
MAFIKPEDTDGKLMLEYTYLRELGREGVYWSRLLRDTVQRKRRDELRLYGELQVSQEGLYFPVLDQIQYSLTFTMICLSE